MKPVASTGNRVSGSAARLLAGLSVKGRAPMTGYARAQFGPAWSDDNDDPDGHNGCDTRNDVLQRDLTGVAFRSGRCVVASGTLVDPYTGARIHFVRGVATSPARRDRPPARTGWQTACVRNEDSAADA